MRGASYPPSVAVLEASPYAPLDRESTATTITVRQLLTKVRAGEVRVPHFQRKLRWRRRDVIELLDSVWRGYPVGSLLFWKREGEAGEVRVGGATLTAPRVPDAWYLVDGQQRTVALAASLLPLDHGPDHRWEVVFDPQAGRFAEGPVGPVRVGIDVPVSVLGDLRRLGQWLRNCDLEEEAQTTVETVQQRLLDYSIPVYIVETDDEQALRAVFARINSTGARMRADEVFQALLGSPGPSTAPDLGRLQAACDQDGFGEPPRAEVLKAVLAMSGHDPSKRLEDFVGSPSLVSAEDAHAALRWTVEFLQEEGGIPHVSLIPYPVVFFILSKWFHLHPGTDDPTKSRLAKWLWRGAATGAHQRAEVSAMRAQVNDIDEDREASIRRLLGRVERDGHAQWELSRFDHRSARSRIEMLALLDQGPRDAHGPIRVQELIANGRIAREVLRPSEYEGSDEPIRRRAKSAANRVLLGGPATGLAAKLERFSTHEAILRSHLIDEPSFERLRQRDIPGFLERRAERVRETVNLFLAKRCAWDAPLLAPLEAYLEPGET